VELLQRYQTMESARLRRDALSDPSPLVRAAAVRSFATDAASAEDLSARLVKEIGPKLNDRSRAVRLAAANRLVAEAGDLAASQFSDSLDQAVKEYRAGQQVQLDRAQSSRNLGNLELQMGNPLAAVESLRTAVRVEPYLTGTRTELSQLLDQLANDPVQAEVAKQAEATSEEIRRLREEEVELLFRDAKLLPTDATVRYMRGRLLYLLDRQDEARQAFIEACELAPNEYDYWLWLALICEKQRRWEQSVKALQRMAQLRPEAQDWKGIFLRVKQAVEAEGGTLNVVKEAPAEEKPASDAPIESAEGSDENSAAELAPSPEPSSEN
jgi:tetratricopeptide (TPR) repeat protein